MKDCACRGLVEGLMCLSYSLFNWTFQFQAKATFAMACNNHINRDPCDRFTYWIYIPCYCEPYSKSRRGLPEDDGAQEAS